MFNEGWWLAIVENFPELIKGVWLTLELVAISAIVGLILAFPLALLRASKNWTVQVLPFLFIFFFRGTPLLVQIYLLYYGAAQFDALRASSLWPFLREPYWCAIIVFSLNTSAYTAELLRGAIQAIPKGELDAADAIGMSHLTKVRRIIIPRSFSLAFPAYTNEVIFILKGSALASTITLLDLTGMTRNIISYTYRTMEFFLTVGVLYLIISSILIGVMSLFNRWLNRYHI